MVISAWIFPRGMAPICSDMDMRMVTNVLSTMYTLL